MKNIFLFLLIFALTLLVNITFYQFDLSLDLTEDKRYSISKESKYKVCGYVTDVEGNMDYFNKYVKISKILEWTNDKKNRLFSQG